MPESSDPNARAIHAAAVSFTLAWALELALARVTSQIQSWVAITTSAALLVFVPSLLIVACLRLALPPGTRAILLGTIGALPLSAVAAGILLPIAAAYLGPSAAVGLTLVLAGLVVTNILGTRSGDGPAPSIAMVLGVVVASTATAWALGPAGFPPFQIHLPFLVASVLLASLAIRANALPMLFLGGVALALWPAVPTPPPWAGAGPERPSPDMLIVSYERLESESLPGAIASVARLRAEASTGSSALTYG